MRLRKHTVLFTLFVLTLAFNAWVYASLARDPEIGPALAASARADAPLLHTYIVVGRPLVAWVGADAGQNVALAAFGSAYASMVATPEAAASLLFRDSRGAMRGLMIGLFWATPVLLLLGLLAWALRSRQTHFMGGGKR